MGKKVKGRPQQVPAPPTEAPSPPRVRFGPDWEASKAKYAKAGKWDRILKQFERFLAAKIANPTQMWNATDKRASHVLSRFYKAHLTHDDSILYNYSQKENVLRIYGIWSHDELGTGDPPNPARLNKMGNRLTAQVFEQVPKSI